MDTSSIHWTCKEKIVVHQWISKGKLKRHWFFVLNEMGNMTNTWGICNVCHLVIFYTVRHSYHYIVFMWIWIWRKFILLISLKTRMAFSRVLTSAKAQLSPFNSVKPNIKLDSVISFEDPSKTHSSTSLLTHRYQPP